VTKGTTCLILAITCCPGADPKVGHRVPCHLTSTCSNTYNQANNAYGNITPNHKNRLHTLYSTHRYEIIGSRTIKIGVKTKIYEYNDILGAINLIDVI
jgi:hypothetical protein